MAVITIIIGLVAWYMKNKDDLGGALSSAIGGSDGETSIAESGNISFDTQGLTEFEMKNKKFTLWENCELIDHRNNDGDSFYVKHPDGEDEVRLYFVDTAESRLHQYNGDRIADQGEYFGGLSQAKTIEAGKKGKEITLGLLKGRKFTMLTKWEMDPSNKRPHVYVLIEKGGKQYYLHEILTRSGLVRTKTRGAELPDGTDFYTQRDKIKAMEKLAKQAKRGAWGM